MKSFLNRNYESFLQSVGKSEKTHDSGYEEKYKEYQFLESHTKTLFSTVQQFSIVLEKFEEIAANIGVSTTNYHQESKGKQTEGSELSTKVIKDFSEIMNEETKKIITEAVEPLEKRVTEMTKTKTLIKTRNKTLLRYDSARRKFSNLKNKKKTDKTKISQAKTVMKQAKKQYDIANGNCLETFNNFLQTATEPVLQGVTQFLKSYALIIDKLVEKHGTLVVPQFETGSNQVYLTDSSEREFMKEQLSSENGNSSNSNSNSVSTSESESEKESEKEKKKKKKKKKKKIKKQISSSTESESESESD
ncbi:bridging integrator 3 [Anaeramoeba flamelloides]|uniref:Bridging integrator 3 n=1 Tax=Anaeramoeba flamelloides TaxID=1746091 RepID=A0ABQ8YYF1_9EUKA|nr:bridging integrator 3 [Anaeramoeba flamelloides]